MTFHHLLVAMVSGYKQAGSASKPWLKPCSRVRQPVLASSCAAIGRQYVKVATVPVGIHVLCKRSH